MSKLAATILVAGLLGIIFTGTALAGTKSVKDCSVCQLKPAIASTSTSSTSTTTSKTHIRVVKTLRAQIQQYEKVTHRIVTIDQKPGGVKSLAGCVDPIQKGWIPNGGQFSNTRYKGGGGRFWDRWQAGRSICNPHRVKWNGGYWMEGTKDNCGNEKIRIQVSGPRTIHKIIPVVRFLTVKSFRSTYDKWISKTTTTSTSGGTTTSYSCDSYGSGWTLSTDSNGNPICKNCPTTSCPPPPPPPSPTPTYACNTLGFSTSNLMATATLSVSTSGGAQFKNATINWGDSQSTTGGLTQTHTYGSAGTYGVQAIANFTFPNGSSASANCSGSVTVSTPPVQHWVQVSCTGFEEITGGGSLLIKCDVSTDDQNAIVNLAANSNDANSRVSGINCYSQGGTPSCKGNGQFEFRVSGNNDGISIVSSSVTVTASANGVTSQPWNSGQFPVDPSGGGFN